MAEHGIYADQADECEGMPVEEIEETYGVHGRAQHRVHGQTGAGHPADEDIDGPVDDDEWVDVDDESDPDFPLVEVLSTESPFEEPETEAGFFAALERQSVNGYVPANFGVLPAEWADGDYPVTEYLQVGRKRGHHIPISLSTEVWLPRAQLWARALALLIRSQHLLS